MFVCMRRALLSSFYLQYNINGPMPSWCSTFNYLPVQSYPMDGVTLNSIKINWKMCHKVMISGVISCYK